MAECKERENEITMNSSNAVMECSHLLFYCLWTLKIEFSILDHFWKCLCGWTCNEGEHLLRFLQHTHTRLHQRTTRTVATNRQDNQSAFSEPKRCLLTGCQFTQGDKSKTFTAHTLTKQGCCFCFCCCCCCPVVRLTLELANQFA